MAALEPHYLSVLEGVLERLFVPHLPALLDPSSDPSEVRKKNLSRALSAFSLHKLAEITPKDAAEAVICDFYDYGIDTIYLHAATGTLYLVQSKYKAREGFKEEDALAFCRGVRKLFLEDYTDFNEHFQNRLTDIQDALENCASIQLVVSYIGTGITVPAKTALEELFAEDEDRLIQNIIDYNPECIVRDMQNQQAYEEVNPDLRLEHHTSVDDPRLTHFGLIALEDLVSLHTQYGHALYAKNIRTFLGQARDVNISIQRTLTERPQEFLYLNNGVTALCETVQRRGLRDGKRKLEVRGLSVINGAQTIASAASYVAAHPASDISAARVSFTLIQIDAADEFGKAVTRARNHQNPVSLADFAALDDEQERLRRDIAQFGIHYVYKAEGPDSFNDPNRIRLAEAAGALALLQDDPRYVVWLKREPLRLLDTETEQYKALFKSSLTAYQLINAVRLNRYIQRRAFTEMQTSYGQEKLAYKHGNYAIAWVLVKRLRDAINSNALLDVTTFETVLSLPFDELRSIHWDQTETDIELLKKGPLALFKNQSNVNALLEAVLITYFGLETDTQVATRRSRFVPGQAYPERLFQYLISKAPQISNLT